MSRYHVPRPVLQGKWILEKGLHLTSQLVDNSAEALTRRIFKIVPSESSNQDVPEEVEWLESGRSQLPFRRDTLWAVPHMWGEMAFGAIGAGTFMFSRAAGSKTGMATGLALGVGAKGLLLLADLGRPERFPKVFAKPNSSWIARGSYAFSAFAGCGALALLAKPTSGVHKISGALADTAALVVMTYDGLFLNESKGVASWTPRLLPILFVADAAKTGGAMSSVFSKPSQGWLRSLTSVSALTTTALSAAYISELKGGTTAARLSARDLTEAKQKNRFLIDALAVGTVVPGVISLAGSKSIKVRAIAGTAASIGTLALRRAVLQAGIHAPVYEPPRRTS